MTALRRRLPLGERVRGVELLDAGLLSDRELRTNLSDLARLNRLPGGTGRSIAAIRQLLSPGDSARILDVGTGAGDMPQAFARLGWTVVAIDANPEVSAVARERLAGLAAVEVREADGTRLPFDDGAVEVAHCSLLLHHLDPDSATALLREMRRVATHGVVINDMRRGLLPLAATALSVTALGRCRATRHDGVLSARRAYTPAELDSLLAAADLRRIWRSPSIWPRVVTAAVDSRWGAR
ncbi:MAG: methyltransferase domain-containing protein [Candidatus Limnocylindria bacterium]